MKKFSYIAFAAMLSGLAVFCMFGIMVFWPVTTVQVEDFKTTKTVYNAGETLQYTFEFSKYTDFSSLTNRELVNGIIYHIDAIETNYPKALNQQVSNSLVIPVIVESGIYRIRMVSNVRVNGLKTVVTVFESNNFTVIAAPAK
jgi:hypothetical protein